MCFLAALAAVPGLFAGTATAGAATAGAAAAGTAAAGAAAAGTAAGGLSTNLLLAATAASTIGAVTAGVGQYQQSKAAEAAARTQAKDALARGDQAAADLAKEQSGFQGQQRAALAASGAEVDYGSADQIQRDTLLLQREDRIRLSENARREAWGYSVEGAMQRSAAKAAVVNTTLNAGSTLLAGASKAYSGYKANRATGSTGATGVRLSMPMGTN